MSFVSTTTLFAARAVVVVVLVIKPNGRSASCRIVDNAVVGIYTPATNSSRSQAAVSAVAVILTRSSSETESALAPAS